ncbi:MAG: hypothetical protein CVT49_06105 [candidate division Zixibacteria bacterium HGW-Zixibacteria-1]|nr:MAG: hypothetical protein CVT49_06105 [candidate division Zixibacteria bacterium HGW-Zixibacteria-1]
MVFIKYKFDVEYQEDKMKKEVKRNTWGKFCRKFSADNMLRGASIRFNDRDQNDIQFSGEYPLMGLTVEKKGRLIDGILFYAGWTSPEKVAQPILSIKDPEEIIVEKDPDGNDIGLQVHTKNGGVAMIELAENTGSGRVETFVRKVAYSMYERRGYSHGNDMGDWLEAERKVKEAEEMFA